MLCNPDLVLFQTGCRSNQFSLVISSQDSRGSKSYVSSLRPAHKRYSLAGLWVEELLSHTRGGAQQGRGGGRSCSQDSDSPSTLTHLWASHAFPHIYTPSLGASSRKPFDWDRSQLRNCWGASAKTSLLGDTEHFSPSDPVFNPFPLWAFPPLLPTIAPPKL